MLNTTAKPVIYKSFVTKSVTVISTFKNATGARAVHMSSKRLKAQIIDGAKIAQDIRQELKVEVDEWVARGNRRPHLIALLVGEDPASATYVKNKMQAAREIGVETFGKHAVVCGRSKNVGMPIAMLLHADGMGETSAMDTTTTICHRYTPPDQLALLTRSADIIVTAAGVPNLIRADMVKPGACIIDVGITRIHDKKTGKSKLVGDVDFDAVREVAGYITPVPGGVGPMTVAMLMKNTLIAAKKSIVYNILEPGAVVHKEASQLRP